MSKEIFYIAKCNITKSCKIYREPPIKLFSVSDATVGWSGGKGKNGRIVVCLHALDRLISILEMPPATCMKVGIEAEGDSASIKVLDRNVNCKVVYCNSSAKTR